MYYAYARVSTQNQREDRQVIALKNFGVSSRKIMVDKQSGKDFNRKNYQKLLKRLKNGDVLVIKSIDRLGRNYDEILKQWRYITKDIGVDIVVLDMELLDNLITMLATGEILPAKYKDHALKGKWAGRRECHVQPNWRLLVYQKTETTLVLDLLRTGTHSDIFGNE